MVGCALARTARAESDPAGAVPLADVSQRSVVRRPVALAELPSRSIVCAGNRGTGSISIIDTRTLALVAEYAVGESISDVAAVPGADDDLLVLDEGGDRLLRLRFEEGSPAVVDHLPVARAPVTVRMLADGARCVVASLWGHAVTVVDLAPSPAGAMRVAAVIDLPFAPREQAVLERHAKLVVSDAFGESFALLDVDSWRVLSVRRLPGHNTRGLGVSRDGKRLLVAHPVLNPLAPTTANDVHWGMVITNLLRVLSLDAVVDPAGDLLAGSWYSQFPGGGNEAGDPGAIALDSKGRVAVALSGVAEVAIAAGPDLEFRRVAVGRRPEALLFDAAGDRVFVANALDDTVSVVDPTGDGPTRTIALGPRPPPTPADRGERLFYDASRSLDSWYSCHSCHTDGHTNGLLNDNFGDGSYGAPKRIPSLLGVGDSGPWAWNGETESLEEQVRRSIRTTLRGRALEEGDVGDLVAVLRSLPAPPVAQDSSPPDLRERGGEVFDEQGCDRCHTAPAFTSTHAHDVGLTDAAGNRHFNPPSLRGVRWRGAYFHDAREADLEAVFTRHAHGLDEALGLEDLAALLAYLRTL